MTPSKAAMRAVDRIALTTFVDNVALAAAIDAEFAGLVKAATKAVEVMEYGRNRRTAENLRAALADTEPRP